MNNIDFLDQFYISLDDYNKIGLNKMFELPIKQEPPKKVETIYLDNQNHSLGFDKIFYCQRNENSLENAYELISLDCGSGLTEVLARGDMSTILKSTNKYTIDGEHLENFCEIKSLKYLISDNDENVLEIENISEVKYPETSKITPADISNFLVIRILTRNDSLKRKIRERLISVGAIFLPPLFYVFNNEFMALLGKQSAQKPQMEFEDLEIEAKLTSTSDKAFLLIHDFIARNGLDGFEIEKGFPHFLSRGLRVCYLKSNGNLFDKIVFYGFRQPAIINKSATELVKDELNLNCILSRGEVKKENVLTKDDLKRAIDKKAVWLDKRKIVFWIENILTGRVYHVANDKCWSNGVNDLSQVEIEYAGTVKENIPDKLAIVADISKITKSLINRFDFLAPTTIRKEGWFAND